MKYSNVITNITLQFLDASLVNLTIFACYDSTLIHFMTTFILIINQLLNHFFKTGYFIITLSAILRQLNLNIISLEYLTNLIECSCNKHLKLIVHLSCSCWAFLVCVLGSIGSILNEILKNQIVVHIFLILTIILLFKIIKIS